MNIDLQLAEDLTAMREVPSEEVLVLLAEAARAIDKNMHLLKLGKALQSTHPGAVPAVTEYEQAAGLWAVIRSAVMGLPHNTQIQRAP